MAIRKRGGAYQIDYIDPTGKRIRKSFKKKKDAEAELGKRVSLIAEKRYLDVKKEYTTTWKELIEKYKENYETQASYLTFKQYIIPNFSTYFGDGTIVANIKYMDVQTYRNHLKKKLTKSDTLRKEASVNREMACLRHIFSEAVEWEMIEKSPFEKKKRNGEGLFLKENNERLRFLSLEEIGRLLKACPSYLRNIVECAINTGMRKGEILSLRWPQIANGMIYLKKTKTNNPRQIPINADLEALFKRIREGGEECNVIDIKKRKKIKKIPTTDHVFTFLGEPIKDVKRAFSNALDKAKIEDFHFHDLRHTFASHLVMNGGSLKEVQELLGHKNIKMTMRYAHLSQEHKKKAVNLLNGLTAVTEKRDCHKSVTISFSANSASL